MSEELSFVEQIRQDPRDVMPRLIYADYLEDSGDPRGELIRVQVELVETPVGNPRRLDLIQRERALLDEHGELWLAPLRALGAEGVTPRCFQRGLIERVKIDAGRFLGSGAELCHMAPALYCLELSGVADQMQHVARFEMPPQITSLDLSSKRLQAGEVQILCTAPWLDHVTELRLTANRLGDDGTQVLTQREMPRLERLSLDVNQLGPAAAEALAGWPSIAHVKQLSLSVNALGDLGVQRLCRSGNLKSVERLDLASNGIGNRGVRYLAETLSLNTLTQLNLRANRIGEDGLQPLIASRLAERLIAIDVRGNHQSAIEALQTTLPPGVVRAMT